MNDNLRWHVQATRFVEEANHERKVQLFFTITLTLLEHQLLNLKQKCSPAALAADPRTDVEAMFSRIANAIKANMHQTICHCAFCVKCQLMIAWFFKVCTANLADIVSVPCCLASASKQETCFPCCYSVCSCGCVVLCCVLYVL